MVVAVVTITWPRSRLHRRRKGRVWCIRCSVWSPLNLLNFVRSLYVRREYRNRFLKYSSIQSQRSSSRIKASSIRWLVIPSFMKTAKTWLCVIKVPGTRLSAQWCPLLHFTVEGQVVDVLDRIYPLQPPGSSSSGAAGSGAGGLGLLKKGTATDLASKIRWVTGACAAGACAGRLADKTTIAH